MRPVTALRLAWFFIMLAVVIVPGAPLQWLLRRTGLQRAADRLQVLAARSLCRALGLLVHAQGALPAERPVFVVANHVSWTDILAFASVEPLCFLAKSDVAGWPLLGPAIRAYGTLFVSRRRTRAFGAVNAEIATALSQARAVLLFAEGTTGNGTRLEPFRSGHLAAADILLTAESADAALKIVPAAIAYTARGGLPLGLADRTSVAWFGDTPLLPHVAFLLRQGPIRCDLVWGEPLPFRRGADRKVAMVTLRNSVQRDFARLVHGEASSAAARKTVQSPPAAVWSADPMPAAPRQTSPGPAS